MWFFEHLKSLEEPTPEQKIWCQHPEKLTVLFIEGDRKPLTRFNLWNIAHVYGGADVGLHIICSPRNLKDMKEWTKDWTNVTITWDALQSVDEYNTFSCSSELYSRFTSTHLLLMQWDSYIFKPIDEKFFEYDYVGAPWREAVIDSNCSWKKPEDIGDTPHARVGNGGFSLRKVLPCYQYCIENTDKNKKLDDVFFSFDTTLNIPSKDVAYDFAVETKLRDADPPKSPVGIHKIWDYPGEFGEDDFKRWCHTMNSDDPVSSGS